jgi:hypothetical protein
MIKLATRVTTEAEAQFISVIDTEPHSACAVAGNAKALKINADISFFISNLH